MFHSALARRLLIPYLLLIAAGAAAAGLFAAGRLRQLHLADQQEALRQEAWLAAALLRTDPVAAAPDRLRALADRLGCRITRVAADGRVTADTEEAPERLDNHRLRPEIVAAAAQGEGRAVRRSDTLGCDMLYVALRLDGGPEAGSFLRLAVPLVTLHAHAAAVAGIVLGVAFLGAAVAGAAGILLARAYSRRLLALAGHAEAMAAGDLSRRADPGAPGELGELGRALNAIAESLGAERAQAIRRREELRAIFDSMREGVIAADARQQILFHNPAAAALLEFPPGDIVGRAFWEIVRDERVLRAAAATLETGATQRVQTGPIRGRHLDLTFAPLESQGRRDGLVVAVHDATESIQYQEMRKEFVANVSHELRTPLTFIKGFVETLRDGALADPIKAPEYLATIERHVGQLTALVADLLELSRLEGRPGLPRKARVDLGDLVRRVAALHAPAAEKKRQTLEIETTAGTPFVVGDPDYLERAVANLVDNAIKYTPEGGRVSLRTSAGPDGARLEVADTGIGIPEADLPRVFERFYRVDKSRSREMGGTGLGLAIVKHIALLHGGSVEAESVPGRGSLFRVRLPAAPVH